MWGAMSIYYTTTTLLYMYALWYNVTYVVDEEGESFLFYRGFGGKFKFLTYINLIIQSVYFGLSCLNDVFGSNVGPSGARHRRSSLQRFRDMFVTTIVFPIGVFVVITFWALYAIDRELVFPKFLDAIVPRWLNHVMHTTVVLFLLIEKFLVYHHYPSRKTGLTCAVGFGMAYQLWILWIAYHADIWVYPVLEVLSWSGRIVFFAVCWFFLIVLYIIGEKITSNLWGDASVVKTRVKKVE